MVYLIALCLVVLIFSHLAAFCIGARAVTKAAVIELIDFLLAMPRGSKAREAAVLTMQEICEFHSRTRCSGVWIWLAASLEDESCR